jgi:haloacetate dehalogenase
MSWRLQQERQGAVEFKATGGLMQRRELLQKIAAAAAVTAVSHDAFEPVVLAQTAAAGSAATGQQPGETSKFLPGFTVSKVKTSGTTIHVVKGGQGPPLLLLHGAPMSHITWRFVGPQLAKQYTVIAPDLRGYGDSGKMPDTPDFSNYSKRAMALDQVEVMQHFGFDKFAVVGHDRGGRVAHRMALDHAGKVTKIAVLDILPTHYLYTHVTLDFVRAYYHWFSYLRPAPTPENELKAQADARALKPMSDVQAEYQRTTGTMENIHAMCEDYRAAASIDLKHDEADVNKKIACPLLTLWGEKGSMGRLYDVTAVWRERATTVTGKGLPGGHNLQEEEPVWNQVLAELTAFLKA